MSTRRPRTVDVSVSLRLALARAVAADDRAWYLTKDNAFEGEIDDLDGATQSGRSFFVTVAPQVLAIDMDDPQTSGELETIAEILDLHGITAVTISSGQQGRRHLFARVTDANLRERLKARTRAAGLDPRQSIRPPLSPHRTVGCVPRLVHPASTEDALAALTEDGSERPPLSDKVIAVVTGDSSQGYDSGSEAVMAVALGAANVGWSWADFYDLMTTSPAQTPAQARSKHARTDERYEKWLQHTWNKAEHRVQTRPARRDRPDLQALRDSLTTTAWPGRTGPTDQAVLGALIDKALTSGRDNFNCSQRELCENAGIAGRVTVRKSVQRLIDGGWIKVVSRGRNGHASTYALQPLDDPSLSHPINGEVHGEEFDSSHDLFRNRVGLGKTAWRILTYLSTQASSAPKIAGGLSIGVPTARKHLQRLESLQLVAKVDGQWELTSSPDLDRAAEIVGALGRGERQRLQHKAERHADRENRRRQRQELRAWGPASTRRPRPRRDAGRKTSSLSHLSHISGV